jgi:hypothetical protein
LELGGRPSSARRSGELRDELLSGISSMVYFVTQSTLGTIGGGAVPASSVSQ